jgi:hypothetical protein
LGARLQYAKVIDREIFHQRGSRVHPGLENVVMLRDDPGRAMVFLVMRAWTDDHGTFTEQWAIEGPGGGIVYESLPRELHLASNTHVEKLQDEVADLDFPYSSDDFNLVLRLDERAVARARFSVRTNG